MKPKHLLWFAVTSMGILFGMYVVRPCRVEEAVGDFARFRPISGREVSIASAIAVPEDHKARARYEWKRLRDPRTGKIPADIRQKELAFAATLPKKERTVLAKGSGGQVFTWSARGPFNVGGRTRALAIDVSDANRLLAGGVSGGMWVSANAGTSWSRTTSLSEVVQSVTCVAQDTRSGKTLTWYYGTGEILGNSAFGGGNSSYRGDGLFKSTDGGLTWTKLSSTSTNSPQAFDVPWDYIFNVRTDPSNPSQDEVYAATVGAIMRSTNGGTSWVTARGSSTTTAGPRYTDVVVSSSGVVYAALSARDVNLAGSNATDKGIWRSTDGVSWTNITPAGFPTVYSRVVIGVAPSNESVVYFLAQGTNGTDGSNQINSHQFWKYTYVSGDGSGTGGTWLNRGANLPSETGVSGNAVFDTQGGYDMLVHVKPDNADFVIVGSTNLYRSTDGFATTSNWTRIGGYNSPSNYALYSNHHPDLHSGTFKLGSNIIYYSGHDGGLSVTSDVSATTVSWTLLNNGYFTTQFYTVALDHGTSGDAFVMGGMQDNGTWEAGSSTPTNPWQNLLGGDGAYCAYQDGGLVGYVSAQNAQIYKLTALGFVRIDPTGADYGGLFIVPFILDPNNNNIMYLNGDEIIWRNNDLSGILADGSTTTKSTNWDSLSSVRGTGPMTALAVSKTPGNILYYGTSTSGVFKLTNAHSGLPNPVDVGTGKGFPSDAHVSCIAIDPNDANKAVAVFSNYSVKSLFYTTNGGTTWTDVSGNLEQNADGTGNGPSCRWAVVHRGGTGVVYFVGTSTGLYSSSALNGTSTVWTQEGSNVIGNVVVDMIDNRNSDGMVVVGTHGNGVFSATVVTSVKQLAGVPPQEFNLAQNYPNPFNPTTTIRYSIPAGGPVRLRVYDATGRHVATLVEEHQTQGTYEAIWDARTIGDRASSGVYFARLEHANRVSTQKMMLLK